MIVDYRKRRTEHAPILINGAVVEQGESFKFTGGQITNKLDWAKYTQTVVKSARQHIFPLRRLTIIGMGPQILKKLYSCTIENITAWLHYRLIWQLLGLRPQGTTEGSAYGPVYHWGQASCHSGPLHQAVSEEGPKNCQ